MIALTPRRIFGSLLALLATSVCASHVACSREPTALVIAVTTDLGVSDDLDELGLYVGVGGEVKTSLRVPTSVDQPAKLPGTLSILQPSDEATPVHVRVAGYRRGQLRVVRDAISTVPSGQLSVIRMPLQWLSATHVAGPTGPGTSATQGAVGQVKIRALDPKDVSFSEFAPFFEGYVSPCGAGQTSSDGDCIDANVGPLPKVSSGDMVRDVFGGALGLDSKTGVAEGGTCFDVETCFANEQTLREADYTGCKVTLPAPLADSTTVNFALVRNPASECTGKGCFVPLDWDGRFDTATKTYTFPPAVCRRLKSNDLKTKVDRIAVATNCDAKQQTRPRCNGLFGAVRDKAPSDPNRAPYYSSGNPPTDGGIPLDARAPDGAPLGPPPPTLLGQLSLVSQPRRLAIANDRLWVRGKLGLGFLDARGPSTVTEMSPLPVIQGRALDDATDPSTLAAVGNSACVANVVTDARPGAFWCYDLNVLGKAEIQPDGIQGIVPTDTQISLIVNSRQPTFVYPGAGSSAGSLAPVDGDMAGTGLANGKQGIFAFGGSGSSFAGIRITTAAYGPFLDLTLTTLGTLPSDLRTEPVFPAPAPRARPMALASNDTAVFVAANRRSTMQGVILWKRLVDAGNTPFLQLTENNVPYASGADGTSLAADATNVYWGGGPAGPMMMDACVGRTPTPRALFPSKAGQDNTTYAVARSGSKLYFATNDGRVYSMDPPASAPCP